MAWLLMLGACNLTLRRKHYSHHKVHEVYFDTERLDATGPSMAELAR